LVKNQLSIGNNAALSEMIEKLLERS